MFFKKTLQQVIVYINYKNLIIFTTIKILNKK